MLSQGMRKFIATAIVSLVILTTGVLGGSRFGKSADIREHPSSPPQDYCEECRWPRRGYIGLADAEQMAVFTEGGDIFKIIGDAPGSWLQELQEGIPFESPEECERWLLNLTS